MRTFGLISLGVIWLFVSPALGQWESGSDGSDGAFFPSSNITIDLSKADSGKGTRKYDAEHWAVVFNYTTITIPANVTVTFSNHPSGAPVIWLAQDDVLIEGTVNLNGGAGHDGGKPAYAEPGPGGFRGGHGELNANLASAGFGPGGADVCNDRSYGIGGSYGSSGSRGNCGGGEIGPTYGNKQILPLIGGSGGSGENGGDGGNGTAADFESLRRENSAGARGDF